MHLLEQHQVHHNFTKHFVHICTLMIASTSATTDATQMCTCNLKCTLLCIFIEITKCICASSSVPSIPLLHCTVRWIINGSAKYNFFHIFVPFYLLCKKKSYVSSQVQHRVPPQGRLFIELFCALLCTGKYTTICICRCNSIVT